MTEDCEPDEDKVLQPLLCSLLIISSILLILNTKKSFFEINYSFTTLNKALKLTCKETSWPGKITSIKVC